MRNEGTVVSRIRWRNVKKSRRIEDTPATAAVSGGRRRGQPKKHLVGPLIKAAVRNVRERNAVGRLYHAICRYSSGFEPRRKGRRAAGCHCARALRIGRQRLCARRRNRG